MGTYKQYEKECQIIRKENGKLLVAFEEWMSNQNSSKKTIDKHVSNSDFYINDFLLYEEATRASEGVEQIGMFLGYWFIKKAMWASKTTIKENATSLKKFYQFLLSINEIDKDSFEALKNTIKQSMPDWLNTLEKYDNPDIYDSKDIWL